MSNAIENESEDGTLIIRFVRPEIRNPLSNDVLARLETILSSIASETHLKRLVFTGSNDVFASGANLREIEELNPESAVEFGKRGQMLMDRIAGLPFVTIAAVNGYCFGGALDLALACRKRISCPDATFCHPGAGLGIITGWGGTQRLPRLIGEARALEMLFTAEPISAEKAFDIGLIDAIASDPVAASLDERE